MFLWKKVKRRFFGKQTPNGAAAQERFIAGALPKRLDSPLQYPPVWRDEERYDTYQSEKDHEVLVKDPYHWLEIDSAERDQFIDDQRATTQGYFANSEDLSRFKDELKKNWDYSRFSSPTLVKDGRWYWYYNSGLQAQYVLYRTKEPFALFPDFNRHEAGGLESLGDIFLDANLLAEGGAAALTTKAFSKCGKYFAYGISLSGSDLSTIYVRPTNKPLRRQSEHDFLPDMGHFEVDVVKFAKYCSIVWTHDSKGFFYQRFANRKEPESGQEYAADVDTPGDLNHALYYHVLGTYQSEDTLVWGDPDHPTCFVSVGISEITGRYLELYITEGCSQKNKLWIADLHEPGLRMDQIRWLKLIDTFEANYDVVANDDRKLYILTDKDAPRSKVVTFTLPESLQNEHSARDFNSFLPECADGRILTRFTAVNKKAFIATYSYNVQDEVYLVSSSGKRGKRLDPPSVGTLFVSAQRQQDFFFVTFVGFNNPGIIMKYTFAAPDADASDSDTWETWRVTHIKGLAPKEFETSQVWYASTDGTKIPMFIIKHERTTFEGNAPAIQIGYGGFGRTMSPFFSPDMLTWVKAYNGIIAVPGIRGGAEFGDEWHRMGVKENRQKVYEDFIEAAKFLVSKKYAAPGKVAINGASNGGTLVAACLNRAPEAFGAGVAEVGVMDLLKFPQFTIGASWISDYGDPRHPKDFDFIYQDSPLHNVPAESEKRLPPTLLLTADHDDRVVPLHSFKHLATMQHKQPLDPKHPRPHLLLHSKNAGHAAGKSTETAIQEAAEKWGFVSRVLGLEWCDAAFKSQG